MTDGRIITLISTTTKLPYVQNESNIDIHKVGWQVSVQGIILFDYVVKNFNKVVCCVTLLLYDGMTSPANKWLVVNR